MATKTDATKKVSAADLIAAAKGKTKEKKRSGFFYDGDGSAAAGCLSLIRQLAELERDVAAEKDQVRSWLDAWYRNKLRADGHQSAVHVNCGEPGELRINYQHRYWKLPASKEDKLREILGDRFDTYFKKCRSFKTAKAVDEDPEKLDEIVGLMLDPERCHEIAEHFAEWFVVDETLVPTRAFTERRWTELTDEENQKLADAGVVQIVSFTDGTKE